MPRLSALIVALVFVPFAIAADPVEKQLALQKAMATAQQCLQQRSPAEAVTALEGELSNADGNKTFLNLLRDAYLSELAVLMKDPAANADRLSQVRRKLDLLVGMKPAAALPATSAPTAAPSPSTAAPSLPLPATPATTPPANPLADAIAAFKTGDYAHAERLFAARGADKLNPDQKAAWAYCRIRLAADKVNARDCDAAVAAAAEKDVTDALTLIPQHAELQKVARQVIAAANLKITARNGSGSATTHPPAPDWTSSPPGTVSANVVETASFRVRCAGNRELAESVARSAEQLRRHVFERWSGPPATNWDPKCEIVVHPTADVFARDAKRPVTSTGTASVRLTNGRAAERTIELRADDATMTVNALPRELTHVVLANLFPDKRPPRWAEEGMAVLACAADESARYSHTLRRCARDGEWFALPQLFDLKDFPAEKITGFYCQSVSLTDYLVRLRGEKSFTIFLRDCERYGTQQALRRQYNFESPQALEAAWKRTALEVGRGQAP